MDAMPKMIAGWELQNPPLIYTDYADQTSDLTIPSVEIPTDPKFLFLPDIAIIDCNAIIDCMASITIRRLPEETKHKLKVRAAEHGRSMEQEAREILKSELSKLPERKAQKTGADLVKAIRDIFEPLGGVNLEIPPRGPIRDPGIR